LTQIKRNGQFSKILTIIVLISIFLIPNFIYADLVPLVRCGGAGQPACQICHLFDMLDRIVDFILLFIVFPIATLLLIVGGGMLIISSGDTNKINQGKSILVSTIIGLLIILSSWLIINTFMTTIGVATWTGLGEGWWIIDCPE